MGFSDQDIIPVIMDLCDVEALPAFSAVEESLGLDGAVAYALICNGLHSLALCEDDDFMAEIVRLAYSKLSSEAQAKFAETGF